jgi:hypothetical protein
MPVFSYSLSLFGTENGSLVPIPPSGRTKVEAKSSRSRSFMEGQRRRMSEALTSKPVSTVNLEMLQYDFSPHLYEYDHSVRFTNSQFCPILNLARYRRRERPVRAFPPSQDSRLGELLSSCSMELLRTTLCLRTGSTALTSFHHVVVIGVGLQILDPNGVVVAACIFRSAPRFFCSFVQRVRTSPILHDTAARSISGP